MVRQVAGGGCPGALRGSGCSCSDHRLKRCYDARSGEGRTHSLPARRIATPQPTPILYASAVSATALWSVPRFRRKRLSLPVFPVLDKRQATSTTGPHYWAITHRWLAHVAQCHHVAAAAASAARRRHAFDDPPALECWTDTALASRANAAPRATTQWGRCRAAKGEGEGRGKEGERGRVTASEDGTGWVTETKIPPNHGMKANEWIIFGHR